MKALRRRPAGGGVKPPHAASVKSRGGEQCGKRPAESWSGGSQEDDRKGTTEDASRPLTDITTEAARTSRDESGRCLCSAQAVSGVKVA